MKNVLVPKIRFKEFNDSWKKLKIKDIANVIGGGTPSTETEKFWNGSIQWFTPSEIGKSKYIANSERTISKLGLENSSAKLLPSGTILLTSRATIGETSILLNSGTTNQGFQSLIAKPFMSNEFIYYLEYSFEKEMKIKAFGSTFLEISKKNLENIEVYITDYTEQEKIANFLSLLDKKIELQQKKIEALKIYKTGLLNKIYSDKCNQEIKRICDICKIEKGKQLNSEDMIKKGKYYVLNGGSELSGYTDNYNTEANTITISEGGNSCGFVNYNEERFWAGGHCYTLKDINKQINLKYLYQTLKFNEKKIMLLRVGSGLPNIQKVALENFEIYIHDREIQNKISDILEKLDKKIYIEEKNKKQFDILKKGLLQKMFV